MKLAALILLLPIAGSSAFSVTMVQPAPQQSTATSRTTTTRMNMSSSTVVTGPGGKPASSFEEDLKLTLQLIMDHEERSTTTSKEQMVQQVEESLKMDDADAAAMDVSIPYDAPAQLAYEASDKSMEYADFKTQFEAAAVADVIAKKPVDVSIPYDAAAKLAFEASDDKSMEC